LAISFGGDSANEIANSGSNFNGKWDCFVPRDAGQGNRDIAFPISTIHNPNAAGETGGRAHPQTGRTCRAEI
jgi:hypothetical protein